jgi:hypothetical protein
MVSEARAETAVHTRNAAEPTVLLSCRDAGW